LTCGWPGTSGCPFERYADDAIVHCKTRRQAEYVLAGIAARMQEVGLQLHPEKTRIVYCKDGRRQGEHEHTSFTFLGYAFRARGARAKNGRNFTGFLPAISPEALKAKSVELRSLRIHRRTDLSLDDLARWLNPIVAGWINYYGRYYRTALDPEQEILPACRELRIGITAHGVLSRGLISGHWSRERSMQPDDFRAHGPRFQGEPGAQPLAGRRPARADRAEGRHGGPDRDRLGAGARRRHRAADRSSRRDRLAESLAALEVELTGDDLAAIERTVPPALRPVSATPSQGMATLDREAGARG
jgi:hypothetical protein